MDSSLTNTALLVMINVLFLSNYFFVRKLRQTMDLREDERNNSLIRSLQGFGGLLSQKLKLIRLVWEQPSGSAEANPSWCIRDVIYAAILGKIRLAPTISTPFPNWRPIPLKLGIVSTSAALLVSVFLLAAGNLLSGKLTQNNSNTTSQICKANDFETKIADFQAHVLSKDVTNFHVASRQKNETLKFAEALVNDTTLYGTPNYTCPNEEFGSKLNWKKYKKDVESSPFFPGYCGQALERALENAKSITCTEKVRKRVCLDDWGLCWFGKTITVEIPITCPPHTYDSEARELKNYRAEQRRRRDIENLTITSQVTEEDLNSLKDSSAEMLGALLNQIDIAGSLYSIYVCIALFFPTPIQLYKPSLFIQTKGLLFGAQKYQFIITVLFLWYLIKFFAIALKSPKVKIYLTNLVTDPCFLDGEFISRRYKVVQDACEALVEYEQEFRLAMVQINAIKPEVNDFIDPCNCSFPGKHLIPHFEAGSLKESNISEWEEINFDSSWKAYDPSGWTSGSAFWSPTKNSTFLGNERICVDNEYTTQEVLVANETELSVWELWITSGLMASILIKISLSNFGIALLKLADPFAVCDGHYECPPMSAGRRDEGATQNSAVLFVDDHVKDEKAKALKAIAIRESLIWGLITNACLASLIVAAMADYDSFQHEDKTLVIVILCITFLVPLFCAGVMRRVLLHDTWLHRSS